MGSILVRAARAAHTLLDASFDGRDVALQPRGMEHSTRGVLGAAAWIPAGTSQAMTSDGFVWSILWYFESPAALWVIHLLSLVVFIMLTVGWKTRTVSVVAWAVTITYCHRLQGVLFGVRSSLGDARDVFDAESMR